MAKQKVSIAVDLSKYRGRYVAMVKGRVVASGENAQTVWNKARKRRPGETPTLAKVPKGETLVLVLCA